MSIRVHYTWIFVFALVTAIVTTQFSEDYPLWQKLILGVTVALFFLLAAAARELILSFTISRKESPVGKITLFAFGGVSQEDRDRVAPAHWPLIYLARFLSNLVIAVLCYGLYATFINTGNPTAAGLFQWLVYIYALLFLLNILPAFPLDGGQILRILLWKSTGDYYKATHTASLIGLAAGFFLIFAGVLVSIVTLSWAISLMMVLTGWIIQIAAGYSRRTVKTLITLQHIKASDVLSGEYPVMPKQVKIGELVRDHILLKGWRYIMVVEENKLTGILTMKQIQSVPGKRWNNTTIGDIMTPSGSIVTARPQDSAAVLFDQMDRRGLDYIPVLEDEKIYGVVTRTSLVNLAKVRAGFFA